MERASDSMDVTRATGLLKVICGPKEGKFYELRGSEVTIGRLPGVDIQIKSPSVSRYHCKLVYSSGGWSVVDLKSQNGTYVNKKVVDGTDSCPLNNKDVIYLGPPSEAPVALGFFPCNSQEDHIIVHPSKSALSDPRSKRKRKPHISSEDGCSNNSEKENFCKTESRKKRKTSELGIVETCSSTPEVVNKFVENGQECVTSDDKLLDTSTSSLESLSTRLAKSNPSKKSTEESAATKGVEIPNLESEVSYEYGRSSQHVDNNLRSKSNSNKENLQTDLKCAFDEVFLEDDNSQSLLNIESSLLIGSDPYPFSQPLDDSHGHSGEPVISPNSRELILKNQIQLLQEKLYKLEESNLELQREAAGKDALYKEQFAKLKKIEESVQEHKEEMNSQIMKRIEEELMCNICTEILIKATVLECSHTFCEHCIYEWKKKKKQCPICRAKITSEAKVLILDGFIDKILDLVNPGAKEKRKEILKKREETQINDSRRPRQTRRRRRGRNSVREETPVIMDEIIRPIQDLFEVLSSDIIDDEAEDSDSPVEGYGYYPGYGRCFNCGRTGHWANGCPDI